MIDNILPSILQSKWDSYGCAQLVQRKVGLSCNAAPYWATAYVSAHGTTLVSGNLFHHWNYTKIFTSIHDLLPLDLWKNFDLFFSLISQIRGFLWYKIKNNRRRSERVKNPRIQEHKELSSCPALRVNNQADILRINIDTIVSRLFKYLMVKWYW